MGATRHKVLRAVLPVLLIAFLAWGGPSQGQEAPDSAQQPVAAETPTNEEAVKNPQAPCLQPAPMLRWQDYKGPFNKIVGSFGRKLERKSTHAPHFKAGEILCSLDTKHKFLLFVEDTIDRSE